MNGIETQVGSRAEIIRLDVLGAVGRQAARAYGVHIVPATLLFDETGELLERQSGMPEKNRIMNCIEKT